MGTFVARGERAAQAGAQVPFPRARLGLFAQELRRAIVDSGLSVNELHRAAAAGGAAVDVGTLIDWRSGRLVPTTATELAAVHRLEDLLGLPPRHLSSLLEPSAVESSSQDVVSLRGPHTDVAACSALPGVARARAALGFELVGTLVERRLQVALELDERGVERSVTQHTEWLARRDGVRAFPVILVVPTPVRGRGRVEALSGCQPGPEYVDLTEGVFATTLLLERPLEVGEYVATAHRTHLPPDVTPEPYFEHHLLRHVGEVELAVGFHPDRLPASCRAYTRVDGVETSRPVAVRGGEARHTFRGLGPGAAGLTWSW